ncbi:MAG: hypothetical protein GX799_12050 [Crenarchaeota archaeon]|nr:hypothetical protein [Thermoproteota archaeon]
MVFTLAVMIYAKKYVEYANARAKLLCLDEKVQYFRQDLTILQAKNMTSWQLLAFT